jgi:hypothetical protein
VTASGHPRRYRSAEAYRARGFLGELGSEDLENVVPVQMDVGLGALRAIVTSRVDDKPVVGMHISRLVDCMVARAEAPGRIAPVVSAVVRLLMILRAWREAKVHEVCNGRLPLAVVEGTHGELKLLVVSGDLHVPTHRLGKRILVRLSETLGALVLLLALLVTARRGRGSRDAGAGAAAALLAEEVDGVERGRLKRRRGGPGCRGFGGGRDGRWVGGHDAAQLRVQECSRWVADVGRPRHNDVQLSDLCEEMGSDAMLMTLRVRSWQQQCDNESVARRTRVKKYCG